MHVQYVFVGRGAKCYAVSCDLFDARVARRLRPRRRRRLCNACCQVIVEIVVYTTQRRTPGAISRTTCTAHTVVHLLVSLARPPISRMQTATLRPDVRLTAANTTVTSEPVSTPEKFRPGRCHLELTPVWQYVIKKNRFPADVDRQDVFSELAIRLQHPEWQVGSTHTHLQDSDDCMGEKKRYMIG